MTLSPSSLSSSLMYDMSRCMNSFTNLSIRLMYASRGKHTDVRLSYASSSTHICNEAATTSAPAPLAYSRTNPTLASLANGSHVSCGACGLPNSYCIPAPALNVSASFSAYLDTSSPVRFPLRPKNLSSSSASASASAPAAAFTTLNPPPRLALIAAAAAATTTDDGDDGLP